ncbi:unnamed protein product [Pedinophyceae sp. YPF-701]|nr:unnamed protein product [Pedinophyceae sp. YPF-701]
MTSTAAATSSPLRGVRTKHCRSLLSRAARCRSGAARRTPLPICDRPFTSRPSCARARRRFRASAGPGAPAKLARVCELLLLFEARESLPVATTASGDATADPPATGAAVIGEEVIDHVWSLQYMVPYALCASAGALTRCEGTAVSEGAFTHAVHMRFGDEAKMEAFLSDKRFQDAVRRVVHPLCKSWTALAFAGSVEDDVLAIFRRGPDFDAGAESVVVLGGGEGGVEAEMASQLSQIARSDLSMAVQCSDGALLAGPVEVASAAATVAATALAGAIEAAGMEPCKFRGVLDGEARHAMMGHFLSRELEGEFSGCPPCRALVEGGQGLPARAVLSLTFDPNPTEGSRTTEHGGPVPDGPWF